MLFQIKNVTLLYMPVFFTVQLVKLTLLFNKALPFASLAVNLLLRPRLLVILSHLVLSF